MEVALLQRAADGEKYHGDDKHREHHTFKPGRKTAFGTVMASRVAEDCINEQRAGHHREAYGAYSTEENNDEVEGKP
jgi:hypothetical protein